MYVPPRLFYLQWMSARRFIKTAIARATAGKKFDITHAHQPQVADLVDVFQCHFLTRVAAERHCLEERTDLRSRFLRLQQEGVLRAENRFYGHWNPSTHMVYCSELVQREFHRLYGPPPLESVLINPAPPAPTFSSEQRLACRAKFPGLPPGKLVAGYIGGLDERKGYRRILDFLRDAPDISLLFAGPFSNNFTHPDFAGLLFPQGLVDDTRSFFAACDVLLVPSYFDPCPLVVFEAAACGTPIIVTDGVGNSANVLAHDAGLLWDGRSSLAPLIRTITEQRAHFQEGALRLAKSVSIESYSRQLLSIYDQVLARNPRGIAEPTCPITDPSLAQ
jgi:glycosyltransferase involved in cell wall biosynthesis